MNSRYPKDWQDIATALKKNERWRCYRCGIQCFSPNHRPLGGFRNSAKRVFLLQVHHWDGNPENNQPENLVCLCTGCHLEVHRRIGSMTPGQVALFDTNCLHQTLPRALPIIEGSVQLKIPKIVVQLSLDLWPLAQPLARVSVGKQLVENVIRLPIAPGGQLSLPLAM
jgi:HNH endonuclease